MRDVDDAGGRPGRGALAWVDGRVVPAGAATVPLRDDGFLRGDAVFETVLVREGRTHALDRHLARMRSSAKALRLRLPLLTPVVRDLLAAWGERDGALKLVVTRGGTVRGLVQSVQHPSSLALVSMPLPWRTPLSGAKTLSYAVNAWATREAVAAHGDDALVCDEDGVVLEVPTAALAWRVDGSWRRPDPDALPILDSVTARVFDDVVAAEGARVELGRFALDDVRAADAVVVLSATRLALPVHALDDVAYDVDAPHVGALRAAIVAHVSATLD